MGGRRFGISAFCFAAFALIGCEKDKPLEWTSLSDEEIALHMQCHDKHGLTSYARDGKTVFVACFKGKKRLWIVKP